MMTCDAVRDLLEAFVDGDLDAGDRNAVAAHLAGCEACRREETSLRSLLARAAALPREIAPRADLWQAVARGIEPRVVPFPRRLLRSASSPDPNSFSRNVGTLSPLRSSRPRPCHAPPGGSAIAPT